MIEVGAGEDGWGWRGRWWEGEGLEGRCAGME